MKSALALLVCVGAHAVEHIDIMAALHKGVSAPAKFDVLAALHKKGHKKHSAKHIAKSDPTGLLGQIMQATGQGLAAAEAHHEAAVKTARSQVDALLQKESTALAEAVKAYDKSCQQSLQVMEASRNASKKDLEKAQKASDAAAPSAHWDADSGHDEAQLNAQLSFVERELRRAERKHQSGVKMALSKAQLLLEDGVQPLSRKVGDMSEMLKPVQETLTADNFPMATAPQQPGNVALVQQATDLKASAKNLQAAKAKNEAAMSAAQKALDKAMEDIEKAMGSEVQTIGDAIVKAQQQEIEGVRSASGAVSIPVPPKKKAAPPAPKKALRQVAAPVKNHK